jgi:RNA polymerase sigma factor (sigma-70 family)
MAIGKSAAVSKRLGATLDAILSDGELLGRFNSGLDGLAEAAFEALVRRHGPMVLRTCGQILEDRSGAEDAFQATFLVLARKSSSIRRPDLLGNWLYGVALRTAREAKMRDLRRRRLESPAADGSYPEPSDEAGRPELALIGLEEFEALHEEVSRLPERYRVPVVLCAMEGLTYEEVARRMGCPASTIGVRLARARERLRSRLIRRGIAPAIAAADAVFGTEGATALMSPALIHATVRGAAVFASGDAAAIASVPASAVTLTHAVLGAMTLGPLKLAAGPMMIVTLAAAVALVGGFPPKAARPSLPDTPPVIAARAIQAPSPIIAAPAGEAIVEAPQEAEAPSRPLPAVASLVRLAGEEQTRGEALFFKEWMPNDPASPHGDGLGPVFNETSCVACHGLGAPGGGGPESKNVMILTAVRTGGQAPKGLAQIHGGFRSATSTVLHRYGTDPTYASWRRQLVDPPAQTPQGAQAAKRGKKAQDPVEEKLREIAERTSPKNRNRDRPARLHPAEGISLDVSERNTPPLFGAGRIDSISSEVLVLEAKSQADEIRGRVSRDRDGRVGRFGWKAQVSRLHEFVRVACAGELGLEVPGHSQSVSPLAPRDKAKGLDLTESECDALVSFVRSLPAPVAIDPFGPRGTMAMADGRRLFAEVGCAGCHAPSLGEVRGIYSDLLLHEMGQTLSDSGEYYGSEDPNSPGAPRPSEWRTPPLWGYRDSGPYMHDGRAETLEDAVALHGGQAARTARLFFELSTEERTAVEAFLKSLVAPSAAYAPGIVLAAELESRRGPDQDRQAETLLRSRRDEAEAREVERQAEVRRQRIAAEAARIAPTRFQMATNLEKAGKVTGALEFYRLIVSEIPDSEEGQKAKERIAALLSLP